MNPPLRGHCTCEAVGFELTAWPMFVHGCHCTWCRRETGAAFAINALIESSHIRLVSGEPELVRTPSASGRGQGIVRCPQCHTALWSHYAGMGPKVGFVRVGTLERADLLPPDIHIFTASRLAWLPLPADVPAVPEYYRAAEFWPAASLERLEALRSA